MRAGYRVCWCVANAIFTVLFSRKTRGAEHIPASGGFIVACNHISFWDPPLVGAALPREVHFLAKEELFANRAFRWLISSLNAIPIRRGLSDPAGVKRALDVVSRGGGLVMFPEGGRVKEGQLKPALPGMGLLSVRAGVPVVPAYVSGSDRIKRAILRLHRVELTFGEPYFPPAEVEGTRPKELYRGVGEEVMKRIARLKSAGGGEEGW
ncbi:MAG: 1-acyl-sn-glycerol-3-phosphate acyltransferase [Candidatus Eisenbacteria bacterium]|nr:1-acyl-sn-glycerol-3-phosphate acyltransferase [Candidatus Eisenbacteria bacterium]